MYIGRSRRLKFFRELLVHLLDKKCYFTFMGTLEAVESHNGRAPTSLLWKQESVSEHHKGKVFRRVDDYVASRWSLLLVITRTQP
jgi:hypothetical protein